jgi:hypothetical protein
LDSVLSMEKLQRQRERRMSYRESYRVKIKSSRHLAFTGSDLETLLADRLHQDDEHDLDVLVEYADRTSTIIGVVGVLFYGALGLVVLAGVVFLIASAF